ncbi:exocyst complex component Sec10-like protein [Globomyces pollinis-pini]|nr:exocyst complex component Sec10-like protein [Globomyces pollinis-pini]
MADLKDLLKLENFIVDDFSAKDIIEKTTKRTQCGPVFDAKPYIRSFESITEELLRLKRKLQNKIEDQEDSVKASEHSQKRSFKEFNDNYDSIYQAFESLNTRLGEVGNTAIRIGEQLETIDKHRTRASDAKDLIHYYLEFNRGSFARLDMLRRESSEGEYKAAIIARRLSTISKEIDVKGKENAKENVEKYCEGFEKSLLVKFDQAYENADRNGMHHIAKTLLDFNGGNSCVQTYVNQHAFFINLVKIAETETESLDQNQPWSKQKLQALKRLYDEIRQAVVNEWDVIFDVFPNATAVIQVFVQRIFAQSIQNFLETILEDSQRKSSEIYLELIVLTHKETSALVSDMHRFDEDVIALLIGNRALTSILNRSFEDLYVPYLQDQKYVIAETAWLTEKLEMELHTFLEAAKTSGVKPLSVIQKEVNIFSALLGTKPANANEVDIIPLPTLNTVVNCIRHHTLSFERVVEMLNGKDEEIAQTIMDHFKLLVDKLGYNYLDAALEINADDIAGPYSENQLAVVKVTNDICQLFQLHFQLIEIEVENNSLTIHRDLQLYRTEFMTTMETKLNSLIQKRLAAVLHYIENILLKQKKTEYNVKDGSAGSTASTLTCTSICDFFKKVLQHSFQYLNDSTREVFFNELGGSFCKMLLDHIKKFVITYTGGLVLACDISRYHEVIVQFKSVQVDEYFNVLKEICSLFIVKPENLKLVLQESYLGRMDRQSLHAFLLLRSDWSKLTKIDKELFP